MYGLKYLRLRSRLGFGTEIWDLDLGPGFGTYANQKRDEKVRNLSRILEAIA